MRGGAPTLMLVQLLLLIVSVIADPRNLVQNGDFEIQYFIWEFYPQLDVLADGEMNYVPFFTVVRGGVQVLDAQEYTPPPWQPGNSLLHMNCWLGPGILKTADLANPRRGATYNLTFDIADNPDGGPLDKAVAVKVLVNNRKAGADIPWFNVSNPETERSSILWKRVSATFVGTGESTTLVFESLVPGSFGCLIDNVKVSLISLVENGSFEKLNSPGLVRDNLTFYNILRSPSSVISNWVLTTGDIKWAGTERWQQSTDDSLYILDMNAEGKPGTILSDKFDVKIGKIYTVLYDTGANPEPVVPIKGELMCQVIGFPSGEPVILRSITIDGTGFSPISIGWQTGSLEFLAKESQYYLLFNSKIAGDSGPFLDNVQAFENTKVPQYFPLGTLGKAKAVIPPIYTVVLSVLAVGLLNWI